mmetsp:Transcript_31881/g.63133  ORF Transcript_31881/g.63133 Transcript_31881/m.63133 type:complete len:116 (-) Transcript_31881:1034-1381(-)
MISKKTRDGMNLVNLPSPFRIVDEEGRMPLPFLHKCQQACPVGKHRTGRDRDRGGRERDRYRDSEREDGENLGGGLFCVREDGSGKKLTDDVGGIVRSVGRLHTPCHPRHCLSVT